MDVTAVLHDVLDAAADRHPDAPAVRHGARVWSYRQLRRQSTGLAFRLVELGVRRGDRVLLALPSSVLVPALLFGCSRIGAVFVVVNPDTPPSVAAHLLGDAAPALVVTGSGQLRELADARQIRTADPGELALAADTRTAPAVSPAAGPIPVDPACFIYTSGSTAMPKAVVCTHQQVLFAATAIQSRLRYRSDDTVFCALPLPFDYGLYQIFLCALAGALLHLADPADTGHRLLSQLHDSAATVLPAVPSLAVNLDKLLARRPVALPRLRLLTNTGAAMPPSLLAALRAHLPGLRVQLMYGLTECKRAAIMPLDGDLGRPGSCGQALPGTEIFTVDEAGARLPAGELGEIVIRGPHVMAGYWHQPALTADRFQLAHGLYPQLRTGDYGWLDDEGYLYFGGRRDDIYKQNGFRVSATEVEAAAHRIPGVRAAVVAPPSSEDSEGAVLLVQSELTAAVVLQAMRQQIDEVKLPSRCVVVSQFPLTANGKVERRGLYELLRQQDSHV